MTTWRRSLPTAAPNLNNAWMLSEGPSDRLGHPLPNAFGIRRLVDTRACKLSQRGGYTARAIALASGGRTKRPESKEAR